MPVQPDIHAIRTEAKRLMKSASVTPLRFTLCFLSIQLTLNLISAAADSLLPHSALGVGGISLSFATVFTMLLLSVLSAGHACYCLGVLRDRDMPYATLLDALPFAERIVLLDVLRGSLIALGLSCFVLPGLVLALAYSQSVYHLVEDPSIGAVEAMRRSRIEMRGQKLPLIVLLLSFWPLLLANGAALVCEYPLLDVFPETLAGDLLYTLACGLISGAVNVFLLPQFRLSQAGFYLAVRGAAPNTAGSFD